MSDKATPIDQWSLDQDNHTGTHRVVRVIQHSGVVFLKLAEEVPGFGNNNSSVQTFLDPEMARAVATILLYAADQAEKQATA